MGRAKEQWMEMQQVKDDTKLAEKLGLSYDELNETEWHIESDESKDGLIYQYIVYFEDGPKHILKKIIGLNSDNQVWLDAYEDTEEEDYYDYDEQFEAITNNSEFFETFINEIKNLRELNDYKFEANESIDGTLRRQLYVGVIATMETYLSDAFIITTLKSPEYKEKFVKTFKDFKDISFSLTDLFDQYKDVDNICKKALLDLIYHNLPKIKGIYKDTLGIDLGNIAEPYKAVKVRHNLVHRNGKNKEGQHFVVTKEIISDLIDKIENFIFIIDEQIKHM